MDSNSKISSSSRQSSAAENKSMKAVSSLLLKWDFPELVELFKEEEIDTYALQLMQPEFRKLVTKTLTIGKQIKFTKYLEDWQKEKNVAVLHTSPEQPEILMENSHKNSSYKNTIDCSELRKILNSSYEGKSILKMHHDNTDLNNTTRNILLNLISSYYCKNNALSTKTSELLAEQVKIMFPNETKEFYFMRGKNNKPAGRIYNKYTNDKGKLAKAGILHSSNRKISRKFSSARQTCVPEEDAEKHNLFLTMKYNSCPWTEIEERWVLCQAYRANFLKDNSTVNILKKWPPYTNPLGYKLIEKDFEYKYPKSESLIEKWNSFEVNVISILKTQLKKQEQLEKVNNLDLIDNKNGKAASLFLLLHHILLPTSKYVSKDAFGKKMAKKYNVTDSQDSFLKVAPTISNVFEKLNELSEQASPIQPFLFLVGENVSEPIEVIVYFDDIKYKCTTFIQAVDICFKIFHVFDLEYPVASFSFWSFLQLYFYKIKTEYDVSCLCATVLKDQLEKIAKDSCSDIKTS